MVIVTVESKKEGLKPLVLELSQNKVWGKPLENTWVMSLKAIEKRYSLKEGDTERAYS